jgi:hypothetical protein
MAEAVALAAIVGAETAGKRLSIQPRTIRGWAERAGKAPADAIARTDWAALAEAARARVAAELASGKLSAVQVATIAGIAERNLRDATEPPPESAVAALDAFMDWVDDSGYIEAEEDFDEVLPELIGRANAEDGQPHRRAMLAWFSGRPEIPAGDVLPWAQAQTNAIIAEHGTLDGLRQWRERRRADEHEAMLVQLEKNRLAAEAWARRSLDGEMQSLLAEAVADASPIDQD